MMTPFLLARCRFLHWVIKKYIKLNSLILEMFFLSYCIDGLEDIMDFISPLNFVSAEMTTGYGRGDYRICSSHRRFYFTPCTRDKSNVR